MCPVPYQGAVFASGLNDLDELHDLYVTARSKVVAVTTVGHVDDTEENLADHDDLE